MSDTRRVAPAAVCVSVDDAELFAHLLEPAVGLAVSIDTIGNDSVIEAHLDAVAITDDGSVTFEYRHLGERCIPHGPTHTVSLSDVISVHVW